MICANCGKENGTDSSQCQWCGYVFPLSANQPASIPTISQTPAPVSTNPNSTDSIPEVIRGWSWGAFLWTWIWSIGNKTWIGLLALLPIPGIAFLMAIILGLNGREWAWKNNHWNSVEDFQRAQRNWTKWWLIIVLPLFMISIISIMAFGVLSAVNPSEQISKAHDTQLRNDSAELLVRTTEYYSQQEKFPWNASKTESSKSFSGTTLDAPWIAKLVDSGIIQSGDKFTKADLSIIKLTDKEDFYICYKPESQYFQQQAAQLCASSALNPQLTDIACNNTSTPLLCLPQKSINFGSAT